MKQGALTYNEETDRYRIRFNLTSYSSDLHCGQCFEVLRLSGQAESQSGAKLAALLYRLPAPAWPQRVSCPK